MKQRWQIRFAVGLLIGFVVLFVVMVESTTTKSDLAWTRLVYLFGSAEALVFAAVGWLFGSEVHRERAESAETERRTNRIAPWKRNREPLRLRSS